MRSEAGTVEPTHGEPGNGGVEPGEPPTNGEQEENELPSELRAGDIVVYHLPKNWQVDRPKPSPTHDEGEEEVTEQGAHRTAMVTMVYLNRRKTKVLVDLSVFLAAGDDPGSRHGTLEVREAVYHPECPPGTFCDVDAESDDLPTAGDLQGIVDKEEAKKEERKEKVKEKVKGRKPDQGLPGEEEKPDQGLPERPEDPARPGQPLPEQPARPDQGLPGRTPGTPGHPGSSPGQGDRPDNKPVEPARPKPGEEPQRGDRRPETPEWDHRDMDKPGADPLGGAKPPLKEGQVPKASPPEKGTVTKPSQR